MGRVNNNFQCPSVTSKSLILPSEVLQILMFYLNGGKMKDWLHHKCSIPPRFDQMNLLPIIFGYKHTEHFNDVYKIFVWRSYNNIFSFITVWVMINYQECRTLKHSCLPILTAPCCHRHCMQPTTPGTSDKIYSTTLLGKITDSVMI